MDTENGLDKMNSGQIFTTSAGTFKIDENGIPVKIQTKGINGGDIKLAGSCNVGDIINIAAQVIEPNPNFKSLQMVSLKVLNNQLDERLLEIHKNCPVEVNIPKPEMVKGEKMTAGEAARVPGIVGRWVAAKVGDTDHSGVPLGVAYNGEDHAWFSKDAPVILLPEGFGDE